MATALQGIKVLELTRVAPGALCGMMLADMGAEVIKLETPPQAQRQQGTGSGVSAGAAELKRAVTSYPNRNKKSIAVDLRTEAGRQILQDLAKGADVVLEGFRPGVMTRLGGDYETLSKINPRLVYCSLSGYGREGPYKDLPGHDVNYLSIGGALSLIGEAGRLPAIPLNLVADYASATLHGVIGILMALMARQHTGKGQFVDISYLDGVIALTAAVPGLWQSFISGGPIMKRGETCLSGAYAYYGCYETKDGKIVTLGCMERHFWDNFCQAIGRSDFLPFHYTLGHMTQPPDDAAVRVREEVREIFKTKTRDEWFDLLKQYDICQAKMLDWEEVFEDPQVRSRNMLVEVEHPVAGTVKQVGVAIKLSDTPGEIRTLAPYLGQHTDDLLASLGYGSEQIAQLRDQGTVV